MTHYHACVWLDHREAKIFAVSAKDAEGTVMHDTHAPKHLHRRADHVHLGKAKPDHAFFDAIAKDLHDFKAILIAGPGQARTELAGYLNDHYPLLAKNIWGIEAMDHPTEPQIVAAARKFFRAEDPMHG